MPEFLSIGGTFVRLSSICSVEPNDDGCTVQLIKYLAANSEDITRKAQVKRRTFETQKTTLILDREGKQ